MSKEKKQQIEKLAMVGYYLKFDKSDNIFDFLDQIKKDNFINSIELDETRNEVIRILVSISERKVEKIKEAKYEIKQTTKIKNREVVSVYFDRKTSKTLSSRLDTYPTNDILQYYNKILKETEEFIGKKEVLEVFYQAYLSVLSHEASMEAIEYKYEDIDSMLDLYNNPRYKEVREDSILPALSDKFAVSLLLEELKFKNIEDAEKGYAMSKTVENLAHLKKLYMIKAEEDTKNCFDYEELFKMMSQAKFKCVKDVIIRRLAYLDINNSQD